MKTTLIAAMVFAVYDCSPNPPADPELDTDTETAAVTDEYPTGPYGYRAAVRDIGREYSLAEGSVFPPLTLTDAVGDVIFTEDRFTGPHDYWAVVVSTEDCVPCDTLWDDRWKQEVEPRLVELLGSNIVSDKIYGVPDVDFNRDTWPEVVRGYPTVFIIDLETMVIIAEALHDHRLYGRIEFWLAGRE